MVCGSVPIDPLVTAGTIVSLARHSMLYAQKYSISFDWGMRLVLCVCVCVFVCLSDTDKRIYLAMTDTGLSLVAVMNMPGDW